MKKASLKEMSVISPLPDLFAKENGERITSPAEWEEHKKHLYRYAVDMQYGGMPPAPEFMRVEPLFHFPWIDSYRIHTGRREHPITFVMQVVWPKEGVDHHQKFPVIVDGDGCFPHPFYDENLAAVAEFGALLVRFNRTELAHDIKEDVRADGLYDVYPDMHFSALAAWAWGFHRCVDALMELGIVDPSLIAFTGHSRGGKTALLAGATDPRATLVCPNGSGAGGAGCYHIHSVTECEDGVERRSEELHDLWRNFPYWFGPEMEPYIHREEDLPFDTYFLKALVAPRYLLTTEALSDAWANPAGTYLSNLAAKEAYAFLGAEDRILCHYRDGYHNHIGTDFRALIAVMRHMRDGTPLPETMNLTPFDGMEAVHTWKKP